MLIIFYLDNIYSFLFPEIIIREKFRILNVLKTLAYAENAVYNFILNSGTTRSIFKILKNF